ncbi:type II toxin-antitoxin system HicB family antitoxin [Peribacillus acanthi]|uniref:type II toxin-antitoxin system HicB family antitoxin n=1 Tax=Peribacillus acanthi TaxID=2171554 RepID=UPI001F0C060A|nr:type II toxin-antitoxin system HicB family antitoxin [Peribacillus acanthi]
MDIEGSIVKQSLNKAMISFGKLVYPAFIQQEEKEVFCVFFPTLFPESGWEYPLSRGKTKRDAKKNAQKDLAYSLAGFLYDNEELPKPIPIDDNKLSSEMELIDIETSFEPYAEEIQEHLKGRHWHIGYYVEENDEYIEAIGFKNDNGTWDIFYEDYSEEEDHPDHTLLFTVKLHSEAEEKFKQFVEEVILKRRGH